MCVHAQILGGKVCGLLTCGYTTESPQEPSKTKGPGTEKTTLFCFAFPTETKMGNIVVPSEDWLDFWL